MLRRVHRLRTGLVRVLEAVVAMIMGVLVLDVLWQVVARIFPHMPGYLSLWTEELATVLLIWVSLLGACVAFERKGHLGIDFFVAKMSEGRQRLVSIAIHATIVLFAGAVLIYGGLAVVRVVLIAKQPLPALGIDMGYVYLALPISGILILVIALERMIEDAVALGGARTQE